MTRRKTPVPAAASTPETEAAEQAPTATPIEAVPNAELTPLELHKVIVTGPREGRWRAGIQFGREPREVEVTGAQLDMILADPRLTCAPAPEKDA